MAYLSGTDSGYQLWATPPAKNRRAPPSVDYNISLDAAWNTVAARMSSLSAQGIRTAILNQNGTG